MDTQSRTKKDQWRAERTGVTVSTIALTETNANALNTDVIIHWWSIVFSTFSPSTALQRGLQGKKVVNDAQYVLKT